MRPCLRLCAHVVDDGAACYAASPSGFRFRFRHGDAVADWIEVIGGVGWKQEEGGEITRWPARRGDTQPLTSVPTALSLPALSANQPIRSSSASPRRTDLDQRGVGSE
jgi:hypothetical protein